MSKQTIEDFFPGFVQRIIYPNPVARQVYDFLLPESVAELCPEVLWQYNDNVVRQPALAISAILGCIVGVYGAILLAKKNKLLLSLSLMTFALMNVSGLFLHCLFSNPPTTYPEGAPWSWMIDCYMTGVSAASFIFASLHDIQSMGDNLIKWFMYVNLIGAACVVSLFCFDATLPLELWYLLTVLLTVPIAGAFFGKSLSRYKSITSLSRIQYVALVCLGLGGTSIIAGLNLDAVFCRWFGSNYYDALTVTNMMFLGCDLAFLGIVLWQKSLDPECCDDNYSRKQA